MAKNVALEDSDFISVGRRHGSESVAREAAEIAPRWERDVAQLAKYGHGRAGLGAFKELASMHAGLRRKRPETVAAKTMSLASRDRTLATGWAWVDMVTSTLGVLARGDAALAASLNEATPATDAKLEAGIGALKKVLEANAARLGDDAEAAARLGEADALAQAVATSIGSSALAKAAPVADTEELDLLDGKLYIAMRDLNAAARRAIRNGKLSARAEEYTFHHLARAGEEIPGEDTQRTKPATS